MQAKRLHYYIVSICT